MDDALTLPFVFDERHHSAVQIERSSRPPVRAAPKPPLVLDAIALFSGLADLPLEQRVQAINEIRAALHECSPFRGEPVDLIQWVLADSVKANDYNPNSVAPPEMALLALSIESDGYTQPIVTWDGGETREVVDGFHRNRVGKEHAGVRERTLGYLPVVTINADRGDLNDRVAATIRHNRARGKHRVDAMSDIVIELKRRNWSDEKIGRELGMDPDEILRLAQISGLSEMFADQEFSQSWDIGEIGDDEGLSIE